MLYVGEWLVLIVDKRQEIILTPSLMASTFVCHTLHIAGITAVYWFASFLKVK